MSDREQTLREAQQAIMEACQACDGQGWMVGIETGEGHDCDGTDAVCAQRCPVPVPVQVQERCEYCGRPVEAIEALISTTPPAPIPETPTAHQHEHQHRQFWREISDVDGRRWHWVQQCRCGHEQVGPAEGGQMEKSRDSDARFRLSMESRAIAMHGVVRVNIQQIHAASAWATLVEQLEGVGFVVTEIPATDAGWLRVEVEALLPPPPLPIPETPEGWQPNHTDVNRVTRLEVIDETGRQFTRSNVKISLSFQDDGRTLKVFVGSCVPKRPPVPRGDDPQTTP